jgi:hypothetical protein
MRRSAEGIESDCDEETRSAVPLPLVSREVRMEETGEIGDPDHATGSRSGPTFRSFLGQPSHTCAGQRETSS